MSISIVCSSCGVRQPISAALLEDDAKRLGAVLADMDPPLARAALAYLRLFKPPKSELRIARAAKILRALQDLVAPGSVCRDERSALRRPATPALWAAGIEQMLARPPSGLPIDSHNYLRAIVYGLADESAAAAETKQHDAARARAGQRVDSRTRSTPISAVVKTFVHDEDKLQNQLNYLQQQLIYGAIDQAQYDALVGDARAKAVEVAAKQGLASLVGDTRAPEAER